VTVDLKLSVKHDVPSGKLFDVFYENVVWSMITEWTVSVGAEDVAEEYLILLGQRVLRDSKAARLEKLDLYHMSFFLRSPGPVRLLLMSLQGCTTLTQITLSNCRFEEGFIHMLLAPPLRNRVTILVFDYCGLNVYNMNALIELLPHCGSLTHLSLRGNPLKDVGLQRLCNMIPQLPSVFHSLDVGFTVIEPPGVVLLGLCLRKCSNIDTIRLDGATLSMKSAAHLYTTVLDCAWIRKVSMNMCSGMPLSFTKHLSEYLKARTTNDTTCNHGTRRGVEDKA